MTILLLLLIIANMFLNIYSVSCSVLSSLCHLVLNPLWQSLFIKPITSTIPDVSSPQSPSRCLFYTLIPYTLAAVICRDPPEIDPQFPEPVMKIPTLISLFNTFIPTPTHPERRDESPSNAFLISPCRLP